MAWLKKDKPVQPNIAEQAKMATVAWGHRAAFYARRRVQASQSRKKPGQSLAAVQRSFCSKK